jgi:putative phosphoribosyl transferase
MNARRHEISVVIETGIEISGALCVPQAPWGLVIIAHPTADTRRSPRERLVAAVLERAGFATLELDLLTMSEERAEHFSIEAPRRASTPSDALRDPRRGKFRFDIPLLAGRMILATSWLRRQPETHALPVGYFGNDTAAAAALVAAAHESDRVRAVVARGGRADLAGDDLSEVRAPTLLIVGSADIPVMAATRAALPKLTCNARLELIPGAAHLFEQSGALELAAFRARDWFLQHLPLSPLSAREVAPASRREPPPISAPHH